MRVSRSIVCLVVAMPVLASAQRRDPTAADALFRDGRALLKDKNYAAACPKLAESYRLDPAPGTLFNLAQCEEGRGRLASAHERWQGLVDALTSAGKLADERLPVARERVLTLGPKVPRLTIRIKGSAPPETVVLRDGVELRGAGLGAPLPVDPGEHVVLARAAYRRDGEARITLAAGESKTIEIEPGSEDGTRPVPTAASAAVPPPPPPPPPPVETSNGRRTAGIVVAGVGFAGLVGAGVTGLMLASKQSTIDGHCNAQTKICDSEGQSAADSGKTLLRVNTALWAVGLIGAGAGAYLILSSDGGEPRTALGVHPTPGGATVALRGALP
jgi:hypothetical protein